MPKFVLNILEPQNRSVSQHADCTSKFKQRSLLANTTTVISLHSHTNHDLFFNHDTNRTCLYIIGPITVLHFLFTPRVRYVPNVAKRSI